MKSGTSSLNPYAEAYIPISRRAGRVPDQNKGYEVTAKDFKDGNQAVWMGAHPGDTVQNQYHKSPHQIYEDPKLKGQNIALSYGSSSQNPYEVTGKQTVDEDYDMDLAYLQMTFPGVSEESLFDVYIANKGDLEFTVDMLNQLELYSVDSLENLPDTLDIGDVSEAGSSSGAAASLKLKNVAGEAGGSSSGPQAQPSPTPH